MSMEFGNREELCYQPPVLRAVVTEIRESDLPLHEQAAEQTGFSLEVVAREGEAYSWRSTINNKNVVMKDYVVSKGFVAIRLESPNQTGHEPFARALDSLRKLSPQA